MIILLGLDCHSPVLQVEPSSVFPASHIHSSPSCLKLAAHSHFLVTELQKAYSTLEHDCDASGSQELPSSSEKEKKCLQILLDTVSGERNRKMGRGRVGFCCSGNMLSIGQMCCVLPTKARM